MASGIRVEIRRDSSVYCTAVYGARNVLQAEESLRISTLMPLAILSLMLLISSQLKRSPKSDLPDDRCRLPSHTSPPSSFGNIVTNTILLGLHFSSPRIFLKKLISHTDSRKVVV